MRDDFSEKTKDHLAKRVSYLCSNPKCRMPTVGPNADANKSTNIGVAAHITAAASGGPRYDPSFDEDQRASIRNGIWLCQTCSRLVDADATRYTVASLLDWRAQAEKEAGERLNVQLDGAENVLSAIVGEGRGEPILPNGLYEREFSGQKVRYFLQGVLLHVEHESAPGIVAYYTLDHAGNIVEYKAPFPLEEYSVDIPATMVLERTVTPLPRGYTREVVRMKWGKTATIGRNAEAKITDIHFVGGFTVDHVKKKYWFAPPDLRR